MKPPKLTKRQRWTISRWRELKALEQLLIECETLNRGSGVIERMERLIKGAEKLRRWGDRRHRLSFIAFLEKQAIADAPKPRNKAAVEETDNG